MSRGLSGVLNAAYGEDHIMSLVLVKLEFNPLFTGTQYYHSGIGDIDYLGDTYTGVGDFSRIEPIVEDLGIKMKGCRIGLQGIDTTVVDLSANEAIQGRPATIFICVYDQESASITEGFEIFSGIMDTFEMVRGEQGSMSLSVESIMYQFDLPNMRRFTGEDHKSRYPNDEFFDHIDAINEVDITWGSNATSGGGVGGAGSGDYEAGGPVRSKN